MKILDMKEKPPEWLIQANKTLFYTLTILAILTVAIGGLYYTAEWARGESMIPLIIALTAPVIFYAIIIKPVLYALRRL